MGVLKPLRVVIENYPEGESEELDAPYHPNDPDMGSRKIPFSKVIYVERDDFMQEPPRKFFRLGPGREVRLRYAYFITCNDFVKDEDGDVVELRCTYDPETKGGNAPDGRKVKGTIHWVSAEHALEAEVRVYDRLFNDPEPDSNMHEQDWKEFLNPDSRQILNNAKLEPSLVTAAAGDQFQLERLGYFNVDVKDSAAGKPVFNRTITLRDSWAKKH
jgi:glutaminyl-tRNA synthetase